MANSAHDGVGWSRDSPSDEDGEEDELDIDTSPNVMEIRVKGNVDQWDASPSSKETPEDIGLLEELEDYQINLEEDQELYDLNELQDLKSLGEAERASPLSERVKNDEQADYRASVSHWYTQRDQQFGDQKDQSSFEGQELEEEGWDVGSEGEPFPELSCEGLCVSDISTSPEALKPHLASYKHGKSCNFTSDDGEELSENSNLPSSHTRSPPEHPHFQAVAVSTQGQGGDHQEFLGRFSSESERSPENNGLSSLAGSIQWSCSPLGRLSLEDFQNSPSIDSDIFPESSWLENLGRGEEDHLMMSTTNNVQNTPQILAKSKERYLNSVGAVGQPHVLEKLRHHQPTQRAQKLKADVPHGLPSKFSRTSRSLSPQRTSSRREVRPNDVIRASPSTILASASLPYGRGQLNYPLPDLSKVEPRVRFPKDPQSYHPPRGKVLPARSKDPQKPVIFKSPAEIVREVLMSGGEDGPHQKPPTAAIAVIPEELKSPEKAKELVHQLQEDYHKLLTKYAEAENTIDRLRLKAKGHFYTDPPMPSHEVEMGTVPQATKVMTFSIPQIRAAEVTGNPDAASEAIRSLNESPKSVSCSFGKTLLIQGSSIKEGFSGPQGTYASSPDPAGTGVSREDGFASFRSPVSGEELTRLLTARAENFRTQLEALEELVQSGRLRPQDQLKVLAKLKEGQTALDQAYQRARDEHWRHQKPQAPEGARVGFDPHRAVEGGIFHLEMRLEELKEKIEEAAENQPRAWEISEPASPPPLPFVAHGPEEQTGSPAPPLQSPIPAPCTPCPEATAPESSRYEDRLDSEASSVSHGPVEDRQGLAKPLRRTKHQVENDFGHLLDQASSEIVSMETPQPGMAEGGGERKEDPPNGVSKNKGMRSSSFQVRESRQTDAPQCFPRKSQQALRGTSRAPGAQESESARKRRNSTSAPNKSSGRQREPTSPRSSEAESAVSECVARTPLQKTNAVLSEGLRLISPETDSGFVGSEASRVSPSARTPKHGSDLSRYDGSPRCGELGGRSETDLSLYDVPLGSVSRGTLGKAATAGEVLPSVVQRKVPGMAQRPGTDGLQNDTVPKGRARRRRHPKGHSCDATSRRSDGISSEAEPGRESIRPDSEGEAKIQGRLSAYGPPGEEVQPSTSPSATPSSPCLTRQHNLLESRFECDRAIIALQSEVSQLRQSLEEAIHGPHGPGKHTSSSSLRMPSEGSAQFSGKVKCTRKASRNSTAESELPSPTAPPEELDKRLSLPHNKTLDDLAPSESDCTSRKAWKGGEPKSWASRSASAKPALLQGPYTGTPYAFLTPDRREPPAAGGSSPGTQRKEAHTCVGGAHASATAPQQRTDHDSQMGSSETSRLTAQKAVDTKFCSFCQDKGKPRSRVQQAPELDRGKGEPSTCNSCAQEKLNKDAQVPQHRLGHTTISAPVLHYIPAIPLTPYPLPPVIYCPPLTTTSASSLAGLPMYGASRFHTTNQKAWASPQKAQGGHGTLKFGSSDGLQDLDRSLHRAMKAAEEMKWTSKRMTKSLAWELSQVKGFRRSCLF